MPYRRGSDDRQRVIASIRKQQQAKEKKDLFERVEYQLENHPVRFVLLAATLSLLISFLFYGGLIVLGGMVLGAVL